MGFYIITFCIGTFVGFILSTTSWHFFDKIEKSSKVSLEKGKESNDFRLF